MIPAQNVPLLSFTQYFYVGAGICERDIDGEWDNDAILDGQFKFTF